MSETLIQDDFELISIEEIFNHGDRCLRIPDYQRGYSWEEKQRKDLIKDIEYIITGDYSYRHYTGTIVASKNEEFTEDTGIETYDIVDGQQRTTSLIILLSVLIERLKAPNTESIYDPELLMRLFVAEGMEIGNTTRKFISGEEQDEVFEKLVVENERCEELVNTKSDQNLVNAKDEFEKWLANSEHHPDDIIKCIIDHLGFLFYAPENDTEIGIMFEVINNRGKSLSQLEKIKNYLIYYSEKNRKQDLHDEVKRAWPRILEHLNEIEYTSNDDEDRFLRNCWIVFQDTNKSKSYHVYENLKEHWPPDKKENWQGLQDFVRFLDRAALTYTKFLGLKDVQDKEEKWLERVKYHPQIASVTPLILSIYEKVSDAETKIELLELLEKLNFRYYGTGIANRADSGQGKLFSLAHNFYNNFNKTEEETGKTINEQWLKQELLRFIDKEANDSAFIQHLTLDKDESGDYYHWQGLKFFLASYEEQLKDNQRETIDLERMMRKRNPNAPNDFFHKEHIWAKNETQYTDEEEEPIMNKRRLGNFILLKETKNISVSDEPVEEKVKLYFADDENTPNTQMIRELKGLYDESVKEENQSKDWGRRTFNYWRKVYTRFLDKHEERLVNFALKRWDVEGLNNPHKTVKIDSFVEGKNEVYHFDEG